MLIDLDSYIRQILPPTWRDAQSIGLAKVLFQPIVALFRRQEKYQEEVFFRAGLTGQKIVLEYYLQSVVDGRITIQDEDGTVVDFSVIVPSTLSASQEKQVYDIVSAYKLAGKRFEVRDVFASVTLPEEPAFMEWTLGFPKLEGSTLFAAVSRTGSFLTKVRYQGNSLYLIDGAYNYQAGVAVNLGDYRLDRTIEVQVGELSAVIQPRPEYAFEISGVEKIPNNADGAWRINFTEAYRGQRNFTIEWYKGTATTPISTYSTGNIDTNQVSYLYFNPKQEEPWKILSNGPSAYRVVVKVTVDGLNYRDEANATFSSTDLGGATSGRVDFTRVYKVGLLLYPHNYASFATTRVKAVADGYKAAGLDTMQVTFSPFLAKKYDTGAEDFAAYDEMISYICNTKGLFLAPKLDAGFSTFALDNGKADGGSIKSAWLTHMIVNPADAGEMLGPKHDISTPPMQLYMGFVQSFRNRYHSYYEQGKILYASIGLDDNQEAQYPFKNIPSPDNATYKARLVALRSVLEEFLHRLNGWDACWDTGCACDNLAVGARNTLAFRYLSRGFLWVRSGNDIPFELEYGPGGREFADNFALSVTSQTGQYLIAEYTKTGPSYSVNAFVQAATESIDRGVAAINFSFFESELTTGDPDLTTIRTAMQANERWTKPRVTPVFQGRQAYSIDQARAGGSVMNGAIRNAYVSTKNSQGGIPPRVEVYYPADEGGVTPSPNPNPNPNPDPVANNASIESASDWQTTTIRAKLTGTPQGSYNIRVLRSGNEVATAVAAYGSNGYVEFSFPSVVSGQDLRGQTLSFVFSGSTSQTIEYFLPRLVFREFTPNYSNFTDDRIFIPRHTKTFDGRHLIVDIGENRGWAPEYFIDGGNGGDVSVLPSVPLPVETRIEIMKNIIPTNVPRYDVGPNYAITALTFWVKVRANYTPKGLWTDEGPIGIPRMLLDANAFTLPVTKKYNMAFGGKLTGPTNEQLDRVSWARNIQDVPLWWYVAEIKNAILSMGVTEGEGGFHTWAATGGGRLQQFANKLKDALNAEGRKIIITDWEPGEAEAAPYAWMWSNTSATAQVQWVQAYLAGFGMQFYEWHQGNSFTYNDKVYEMVSPSGHFNYYTYRPSNNAGYFHGADDYIDLFANLGSVSYPAVAYARGGSLGYNNVTISTENSYNKPNNKKYHAVPNILFALMTTNFFSIKVPNTKLIAIQWFCEDQNYRRSMTQHRFKPNPSMQGFVRGFDIRYVYSQNLIEDFCLFEFLSRNVYLQHIWSTASNCDPNVALWFATRNGQPSCGSGVNKGYNFEGPDNYACPTVQDTYVGMEGAQHEARIAAGERYDKYKAICDGVNNQLFLSNAFEYRRSGQSTTWTSVAASNGDEHARAWKHDQPFLTIWKNSVSNKYVIFFWDLFAVPYTPVEFRFTLNGTAYTRIANGNRAYDEAF